MPPSPLLNLTLSLCRVALWLMLALCVELETGFPAFPFLFPLRSLPPSLPPSFRVILILENMALYGILPDMQISNAVARALSFCASPASGSDPSDLSRGGNGRGRPAPPLPSLSAKDVFEAASSKDFTRLKRSVTVSVTHTSPAVVTGAESSNRRHTLSTGSSNTAGSMSGSASGSGTPLSYHSHSHSAYHSGQRDQFVSAKMAMTSGAGTSSGEGFVSSERFSTQLCMADRTLDFLFPNLVIDLSNPNGTSCPRSSCQRALSILEIIKAFPTDSNCYTIRCPSCQREFVPRFTVSCSLETWEGSEGRGTPLWCELLSPWVLQKELLNVIGSRTGSGGGTGGGGSTGVELVVSPSFRDSQLKPQCAVLFWNLLVYFRLYGLPYAFLVTEKMSLAFLIPLDD
jgi:hypothetical protein